MEFHSKLLQPLPGTQVRGWNGPLPFYMAYPGYYGPGQEELCLRDLEYLQQLYPDEVKRFQRRIAEILERSDYEGSMIYDEYPDRYSMRRLALSIGKVLQNENEEEKTPTDEMIQILLLGEIYERRHGGKRAGIF